MRVQRKMKLPTMAKKNAERVWRTMARATYDGRISSDGGVDGVSCGGGRLGGGTGVLGVRWTLRTCRFHYSVVCDTPMTKWRERNGQVQEMERKPPKWEEMTSGSLLEDPVADEGVGVEIRDDSKTWIGSTARHDGRELREEACGGIQRQLRELWGNKTNTRGRENDWSVHVLRGTTKMPIHGRKKRPEGQKRNGKVRVSDGVENSGFSGRRETWSAVFDTDVDLVLCAASAGKIVGDMGCYTPSTSCGRERRFP